MHIHANNIDWQQINLTWSHIHISQYLSRDVTAVYLKILTIFKYTGYQHRKIKYKKCSYNFFIGFGPTPQPLTPLYRISYDDNTEGL